VTASNAQAQLSDQIRPQKMYFSTMIRTGMPKKMPETTIRRPRASSIQVVVGILGTVDESLGIVEDDGIWSSVAERDGSSVVGGGFDGTEAGAVGEREDVSEPDARVESREAGAFILKSGSVFAYSLGLHYIKLLVEVV